jgi:hypothetical protein
MGIEDAPPPARWPPVLSPLSLIVETVSFIAYALLHRSPY